MLEPGNGHLEVAGARIEVRSAGPPPNRASSIVMLHEGLGSAAQWRDFPERLAEATGYGVLAYSRAGYGTSSPCALPRPLSYMHDEALETLPALLEAVGFKQGILLGHSDGASIAAIYAGARRDPRLKGLILMAPHFFTEDMAIAAIAEAKTAYEQDDLRERLVKHHGDNVDCAFWGWNGAWLDPDFRRWDIREYLPGIRVPLLLLQGEDDRYGTAAQIEAARAGCPGPTETVLLPDCRHSPQRDQPDRSLAEIAGFLARLGKS